MRERVTEWSEEDEEIKKEGDEKKWRKGVKGGEKLRRGEETGGRGGETEIEKERKGRRRRKRRKEGRR